MKKEKVTNNNVMEMDPDLEFIDIDHKEGNVMGVTGKNRTALIVMMMFVAAIMLTITLCMGCSDEEATTSDNPEPTTEDVVETPTPPAEEVTVKPEVTEPVDSEPEPEPEPEPEETDVTEGPQTAVEWAESLDNSELIVGIWDEDQKQGTILENHQEICISEGDSFIAVGKNLYGFSFTPDLIFDIDNIDSDHHLIFKITEEVVQSESLFAFIEYEGNKEQAFTFYIVDDINQEESSENKEPENVLDFVEGEVDSDLCVLIADEQMNLVGNALKDGDSHTLDISEFLWIYLPKKVSNVTTTTENVKIWGGGDYTKALDLYFTDTNVEIPITVEYEDGTTEEITIYITKEW